MFTLGRLAEICSAELIGAADVEITGIAAVKSAQSGHLTFIGENKFIRELSNCKASAVIIHKKIDDCQIPQLVVENVDAAMIAVLEKFVPPLPAPTPGIHPSAVIEDGAQIAPTASIGPLVFIDKGVKIGDSTVIGPGCKIGYETIIGSNCNFAAGVVVYHQCRIGNNCVFGANTTIGSIGFGYSFIDGQHRHIPHVGGVIIEDFVDVGVSCCVDRAKFGNTIIGAGTKMDNLIQIGHNVIIEKCCLIVSQVGIAGSSKLGNGVVLAGQVGVRNHVEIGDGTKIGAQAGVVADIGPGLECVGSPAIDAKEKIKQIIATQKLPAAIKQLKKLEKKIEALEATVTEGKKS